MACIVEKCMICYVNSGMKNIQGGMVMSDNMSATELAFRATYDYEDESFAEDYIESLDCVTVFRDEIKKNLPAAGFSGDMENNHDIIDFVCECCERAFPGVFNDPNDKSRTVKFNRTTLSRWLESDDVPMSNIASREIMYKLCFALDMDEVATKNFFFKGCLERPFNFKDIRESVYYFCLKHRKSYAEAMAILEKIESAPATKNPDADNLTSVIANRIQNIQNEEDLIAYLIENRSGFEHHNSTAHRLIEEELLPTCMRLATEELNQAFDELDEDNAKQVDSIDKLLAVIYGYNARKTYRVKDKSTGKKKTERWFKYSISHKTASKFPRLIKENFPQREQFQQISKHEASTGVIRKALILLKFYEFFTGAYLAESLEDDPKTLPDHLPEEFVLEMNATLEQCGYVQLYWRNPFDWMIGHCARFIHNSDLEVENPVDRLRDLISTFYLDHQEKPAVPQKNR